MKLQISAALLALVIASSAPHAQQNADAARVEQFKSTVLAGVEARGKLVFGVLQDATGRVQLFASASWTDEFDAFKKLSLGDWVGATGRMSSKATISSSRKTSLAGISRAKILQNRQSDITGKY